MLEAQVKLVYLLSILLCYLRFNWRFIENYRNCYRDYSRF